MTAHKPIYVPHALHAPNRVYRETNCYTDVLIDQVYDLAGSDGVLDNSDLYLFLWTIELNLWPFWFW